VCLESRWNIGCHAGVLTGPNAARQSSGTYASFFNTWSLFVFDMSARLEKLAVAKTPSQPGFASIPPPFAADLFNRPRRFSAA
jgi:hypothetical protein